MLSIVIPTLNEEENLPRLLASIKRQDYRDFEVIVADFASQDQTMAIALSQGCILTTGGTPAQGRNNGARIAKGDWLLFLDADVILPSDFLTKSFEEIKKKNLDIATAYAKPLSNKKIDKFFIGVYNFYAKITRPFYPHAPGFCIFIRKNLHERINGFDEKIKLAEDHDYVLKASHYGKFGLISKIRLPVSMRRFDKDGHFKTAAKFLAAETHRIFLGKIETDLFNYRFGHYKEEAPLKKNSK